MDFKVNLNQSVKVKLTDYGISILKKRHDELNSFVKSRGGEGLGEFELILDDEGYYTTQLWSLMDKFGHTMEVGAKKPFDINVIIKGGEPIGESQDMTR